jgi:hypothetical protein
VRDLDDLEPVVGRAPGIARIGLTRRFRHFLRRGLNLLAALLRATYSLMMLRITGTSRGAARRCRLFSASSQGQRSRERVPSPGDPASEKVVCERDGQAHQARSSPGATQKAGLSHVDDIAHCGRRRRPPRAALTRSSCVRQSNVYAGLMGSVEAVPRTLPMSPMGH